MLDILYAFLQIIAVTGLMVTVPGSVDVGKDLVHLENSTQKLIEYTPGSRVEFQGNQVNSDTACSDASCGNVYKDDVYVVRTGNLQ